MTPDEIRSLTLPSATSGTALVLLLVVALVPALSRPLRRLVVDPVVAVATLAALLLSAAATGAVLDEGARGSGSWGPGLAVTGGVLASVLAGSHVVRAVFRLTRGEIWPRRRRAGKERSPSRERPSNGASSSTDGDGLLLEAPGSVLRGGAWIGYLERAAVTGTLLAGFPEGLALVLAIKGVGRYPELRDAGGKGNADAPEEFIIGTLASLLWATATAGAAQLLR